MTHRQQQIYKDRCDLYIITDSVDVPTYQNIPCLLERKSIRHFGNCFSELNLNIDRWYFSILQPIEENWVICLQTEDHPEKGGRWLIRGSPKGRGGRVCHWEVTAERHFITPNPLM